MHVLHMQFVQYVTVGLCNIGINTAIVYLMVNYLSVHYLVAQTTGAGVLALWSYFAYSRFIFAAPSGHHTE